MDGWSEVKCELRVLAQEIEGEAMVGRGAMKSDGFAMHFGGITLVAVPSVLGVLLMDILHEVVPVGLGQDARGSYGKVFSVTFHDGGVG